ncbi:MAG: M23 family metallopeptidase [Fibrobacteria bacterium]|nr:M23 family metallopeptidase [Fibrobacteria bacterium]
MSRVSSFDSGPFKSNPVPPPKRIPVLRILVALVVLAFGVYKLRFYLKQKPIELSEYVDVTDSTFLFKDSLIPKTIRNQKPAIGTEIMFTIDSSSIQLKCKLPNEDCFYRLDSLYPDLGREISTVITKKVLNNLAGHTNIINYWQFFFDKKDSGQIPNLYKIIVKKKSKAETYRAIPQERQKNDNGIKNYRKKFCNGKGKCLSDSYFNFPVSKVWFKRIPNAMEQMGYETVFWPVFKIKFWGLEGAPIGPISKGKVVAITSIGDLGARIRLYHGNGLFVWYENLSRIHDDILLGDYILVGQIIGYAGTTGTKVMPDFSFNMEKDGTIIDIWDFFGLTDTYALTSEEL